MSHLQISLVRFSSTLSQHPPHPIALSKAHASHYFIDLHKLITIREAPNGAATVAYNVVQRPMQQYSSLIEVSSDPGVVFLYLSLASVQASAAGYARKRQV
jgi:hypothetical protein